MRVVLIQLQEPKPQLIGLFQHSLLVQELQIQQRNQKRLIRPNNGPMIQHQAQRYIGNLHPDSSHHLIPLIPPSPLLPPLPNLQHPLITQQLHLHPHPNFPLLRHLKLDLF